MYLAGKKDGRNQKYVCDFEEVIPMSKEHTEIITCPECGKKSDFTVWDSLNTMIDPEEKEKIINGELFRFTCPECGFTTMVDYAIL